MSIKHDARIEYLEGAKLALAAHMKATEEGILNLPGLDAGQAKKLIKSVRKRHAKLLHKIDVEITEEVGIK